MSGVMTAQELSAVQGEELRLLKRTLGMKAERRVRETSDTAAAAVEADRENAAIVDGLEKRLLSEHARHREIVAFIESELEVERRRARREEQHLKCERALLDKRHRVAELGDAQTLEQLVQSHDHEFSRNASRADIEAALSDPPPPPTQRAPESCRQTLPPAEAPQPSSTPQPLKMTQKLASLGILSNIDRAMERARAAAPVAGADEDLLSEAYLKKLFCAIDTNFSGTVSTEEVLAFFRTQAEIRAAPTPTLAGFYKILGKTDAMGVTTPQGETAITFDEFCVLMMWLAKH
ncbi:hypothetical protein DIPPA_09871 [Diplonema papillatum]|nr:hypothetical protein DIPPA_09871 [Diplonema papillatum]|eukprot:gene20107-30907_t